MKSAVAAQVAILLLLVASAASCEVAKEYSTRVFKPMIPQKKSDSTVTALKFMEFDSGNASDSIDIKEFFAKDETVTDNKPEVIKDTTKKETVVIENTNIPRGQPIDATKRSTTRSKKIRQ
jgi:hypothetical protein